MRAWRPMAVLILLAACGGWWLWGAGAPRTEPSAATEGAEEPTVTLPTPPTSLAASPGRGATPAGAEDPPAPAEPGESAASEGSPVATLPPARMEGVVLDDAGRPVPGARVRVTPHIVEVDDVVIPPGAPEPAGPPVLLCGADGRFVIPELRAGRPYSVEAQSTLHAGATVETLPAESGKVLPVEVRLAPARFLELVILDAATAAPIEGAKVSGEDSPFPLPGEAEPSPHQSDAAGRYRVGPVPLGAVELTIEAEGYLKASRSIPAASEGAVEVNLVRGLTLSGRVLRPDGTPAGGASVSLRMGPLAFPFLHTAGWIQAEADAAGAFSFAGLPQGRVPLEATYRPAAPEGAASETGVADPEAGTTDCVIRLRSGSGPIDGILTIHVLDPDGLPVPSGRIYVSGDGWSTSTGFHDGLFRYDPEGRDGVGTIEVRISDADDAAGKALPLARAKVAIPASQREVTVRLERSEPIEGVVRGPDGAPVAGVQVVLSTAAGPGQEEAIAHATTDEGGRFALLGAGSESCRVAAHPLRGLLAPAPIDVRPGATGIELHMRAGASAVVTVLDPTGVPLRGARVTASNASERPGIRWRGEDESALAPTTDAAGRATLSGLDATWRYRLTVEPTGAGVRGSTTESWLPADTTVRLARALRIAGIVRDREGNPVPTAQVELEVDGDSVTHAVDGAGRFVIDDVPEGLVRLRAVPGTGGQEACGPIEIPWSDLAPADAPRSDPEEDPREDGEPWVSVRAGATDVVLTLDLGATLLVRVAGWSPEEAAGASPFGSAPEAVLVPEGAREPRASHRAPVADDGTIRFHRLDPARTYTLWVSPVGARSLRKTGVRAAAELRVRLEPGKTLSLRVVGPGPIEGVSLELLGCPLSLPWHPVQSDGTAELRGFPPGRYTVRATCTVDGRPHLGQVSVEAGGPRVDVPLAPAPAASR